MTVKEKKNNYLGLRDNEIQLKYRKKEHAPRAQGYSLKYLAMVASSPSVTCAAEIFHLATRCLMA